jgi:hypothetical protein
MPRRPALGNGLRPKLPHRAGGVLFKGSRPESALALSPKNKNAGEIMEIAQKLAHRRGISLYLD